MRAHYFQHVPFEGLGSVQAWLVANGYQITATRFYEFSELPDLEQIDLLVVMGGPMSVNDEAIYPWLVAEKSFIRTAVQSGKRVLGVCLGAQLIASALGARVYPNAQKEIGWFPIQGIASSERVPFCFPSVIEVFHWHGETFDLPPGAVRIAGSSGCENQAFQIDDSVIGLQFHLETTKESARSIIENCRDELIPARYIQSEQEILSAEDASYFAINRMMDDILSYLTNHGGEAAPRCGLL